jgi:hypothetical protein
MMIIATTAKALAIRGCLLMLISGRIFKTGFVVEGVWPKMFARLHPEIQVVI